MRLSRAGRGTGTEMLKVGRWGPEKELTRRGREEKYYLHANSIVGKVVKNLSHVGVFGQQHSVVLFVSSFKITVVVNVNLPKATQGDARRRKSRSNVGSWFG